MEAKDKILNIFRKYKVGDALINNSKEIQGEKHHPFYQVFAMPNPSEVEERLADLILKELHYGESKKDDANLNISSFKPMASNKSKIDTGEVKANIKRLLLKYWGYNNFLPIQEDSIRAILSETDSLTILPTGGGKSLCYQLPALIKEGLAIVISPLISLMKDQVDALSEMGIPSAFWNSTLSLEEKNSVERKIKKEKIKMLYLAPEGLNNNYTKKILKSNRLSFFVIDEAHCVSQWGHDFRPDYRKELAQIKKNFNNCCIHAFTATATKVVQRDIIKQLKLDNARVFEGNVDRPNLTFRVSLKEGNNLDDIVNIVNQHKNQPGIIYCRKKADVDKYSKKLLESGFDNLRYHSGIPEADRKKNQLSFKTEEANLMIATIAFGMGIDKSNIRFIIHTNMPKSIEAYYQEVGRAGRDGLKSYCYMFYSGDDYRKNIYFIEQDEKRRNIKKDKLNQIYNYCGILRCRHKTIVEYFDQEYKRNNCEACDYCLGDLDELKNSIVIARGIIRCVQECGKFGGGHIADVLFGKKTEKIVKFNHNSLKSFGLMRRAPSVQYIRNIIEQMISQGILGRVPEYQTLFITDKGQDILKGRVTPILAEPQEINRKKAIAKEQKTGMDLDTSSCDIELFEKLKKKRAEIAQKIKKPAFIIFHDRSLKEMSTNKPVTEEDFFSVSGVGEAKFEKYGQIFLKIIKEHLQQGH